MLGASTLSNNLHCSKASCHKWALHVILNSHLLKPLYYIYFHKGLWSGEGVFLYSGAQILKHTYTYWFRTFVCFLFCVLLLGWLSQAWWIRVAVKTKSFNDSLTEGICLKNYSVSWHFGPDKSANACSLVFLNDILWKLLHTVLKVILIKCCTWCLKQSSSWGKSSSAMYIMAKLLNAISLS